MCGARSAAGNWGDGCVDSARDTSCGNGETSPCLSDHATRRIWLTCRGAMYVVGRGPHSEIFEVNCSRVAYPHQPIPEQHIS
eukprot:5686991-Pyramimonas_sp.AAC.1